MATAVAVLTARTREMHPQKPNAIPGLRSARIQRFHMAEEPFIHAPTKNVLSRHAGMEFSDVDPRQP